MNLWNVTYIREDCVTVSVDNRAFGLPSGAPTVTVGCFGAFVLKLRMWFSKSADGAPTEKTPIIDDIHRPRFSTSPSLWDEDDSRYPSIASESELRLSVWSLRGVE